MSVFMKKIVIFSSKLVIQSEKLEWIIDGKILAVGDTFALYEKDDGVWIADWRDPLKNSQ